MFKKVFLFITTIFAAISASTGYDSTDSLKGDVNPATFLDWFHHTEKYVHSHGLIVLDLIPALFLITMAVLFYKDGKKLKSLLTLLALLLNLVGVFLVIQLAYPIAIQMKSWTPDNLPTDWITLKDEWIGHIGLYGLLGLAGWVCFLITYFVPAQRNAAIKPLPRFLNFIKNAFLFFLTFSFGLGATRLYGNFFFRSTYDISGVTFIEMHRPLDIAIRAAGPYVFIFMSTVMAVLAILFFVERSKTKAWLVAAAFIFLLCDTFIALQGNGPLNDLFLTWTPTTIPDHWASLRDEWLNYHLYRNIFLLFLFSSLLLIYFVPARKEEMKSGEATV